MTEPESERLLRFSDLKLMGKSPLHYLHRSEGKRTTSLDKGSALHALVFDTRGVVPFTGKQRRGAEWEKFQAEHADELIVTAKEYESVARMADAVLSHADARELLLGPGTVREETLHFDYLGTPARATPDARHPERTVELKSGRTSDPEPFMWQAKRYAYHAQLAFYRHAVRSLGLGDAPEAYVVAVESSAPEPVTVLRLTERTLVQGERLCRLWYERLRACEEAGQWPPYVQSIVDWDIDDDDIGLTFADETDSDESEAA